MRKKVPISVRFDADRLSRLDEFIETLIGPPDRTAVIEQAVDEFMERHGKERTGGKRK